MAHMSEWLADDDWQEAASIPLAACGPVRGRRGGGALRGCWNLGLYSAPLIHFVDDPWCSLKGLPPRCPGGCLAVFSENQYPRPFQQWLLTRRLARGLGVLQGDREGSCRGQCEIEVAGVGGWVRGVSLFLDPSVSLSLEGESGLQVPHRTTRCRCFLMDGRCGLEKERWSRKFWTILGG